MLPRPKRARLHLDEVADVHVVGQLGAGARCARTGRCARWRRRSLSSQVREGLDLGAGAERDVAQHAVRADAHAVAERDLALEDAVHVDRDVAPARELAAHVDARRVGEGDARLEELSRRGSSGSALERRRARPCCSRRGTRARAAGWRTSIGDAVGHGRGDDVGQVVLALRVVVAQLPRATRRGSPRGIAMIPVLTSRMRALRPRWRPSPRRCRSRVPLPSRTMRP